MKNALLLFITNIIISGSLLAQCPPTGYTANGQAAVDNFSVLYPNCTELNGTLFIFGEVSNLNAFSNLTSIGENLVLSSSSQNMNISGLSNIVSISGNLTIQGADGITSLAGLESLVSVSGNLNISSNPVLLTTAGLANLNFIGGAVLIENNSSLQDLNGLQGISALNDELSIVFNLSLNSLEGLNNIQTINGRLRVSECPVLTSIGALQNLQSVGAQVFISACGVGSLDGLENLQSIGTYLTVQQNPVLQSIDGLNHPISIGSYISFVNNTQLSNCAVQAVCELIAEDISLVSAVGNAPGCSFAAQIEQQCNCAGESLDYSSSIVTCGNYVLGNTTYTESGTYLIPYTNSAGCSGIITLNLTLNNLQAEMQVNGNVLSAVGNFIDINWLDCNNNFTPIIGATFPDFIAVESGSYAFEVYYGACTIQSECEVVVVTSINQRADDSLVVFPNPVKDVLRINSSGNVPLSNLRFYTVSGKLINDISVIGQSDISVDISDFIPGIYILEITSALDVSNFKIAKQ
jgi:hypothetical protein